MGDRANVVVLQWSDNPPVVLYSHWYGERFLQTARDSVDSNPRIGDPSYFTRLLIREVTHDSSMLSGVGTSLDDNEHPVLVINSLNGESWTVDEQYASELLFRRKPSKKWAGDYARSGSDGR